MLAIAPTPSAEDRVDTRKPAVQLRFGFKVMASPRSTTLVNAAPVVQPPVEELNSVRATLPAAVFMTCPAVSRMARSDRASSSAFREPVEGHS
jgi:hypothetical protein